MATSSQSLLLGLLLILPCLCTALRPQDSDAFASVRGGLSDSATDFLKGFLQGIQDKGNVTDLSKCVKDFKSIFIKLTLAVENIKKMDVGGLTKGLTLLIEAIGELLTAIKPCSDGFEQIKKLIDAMGNINILRLVFRILAYPTPYIEDVKDCVEAFKKELYQRAGKDIGDILFRLFLEEVSRVY